MHNVKRAILGGCLLSAFLLPANASWGSPPPPPSAEVVRTQLGELRVAPPGSQDGYDRDKFRHWIDQGDSCNTREVVLKRDGENVQTDSECRATSGRWYSVYEGAWQERAEDIDIDHIVPLAEAWRSGARDWSDDQRQTFANDLEHAQLIAVTDRINQEKGDKSPDKWKPSNEANWCDYSRYWISVKHTYQLTITDPEKSTLSDMLNRC